jgi:hypothetical protein
MAPKLKKDGTERKSYVRKTQAQENEREDNPKPILQRPMQSEEQIEQQRAIMRQTLRGIAEPMRDRFEIGSCYDCALGLEIWLSDNSKVFPEKPLKQKLDRMHQIQKLCVEQPEKLDREQVYWELAGLYIIVNREASRPELNISKPSFVMVAPEKFEEDPTVDKRANDSRKQELYLPCCSPDDLLEKNVVEQMLLEVEQELERRVDELMEDGEREE